VSFAISGTSLNTAASFDYETKSSYSILVRVTDSGGFTFEKQVTINVTDVDDTAPSIPTDLLASNVKPTSVKISWTASTDNVGVMGYYVYVNGEYVRTESGTTTELSDLTQLTTYSVQVVAFDAADNRSENSVAVSFKTGDGQKPTVPTNFKSSTVTKSSVRITWTASTDNVGVKGYNVYVNGSYARTVSGAVTYLNNLTSSTKYTLQVIAYDAVGNRSEKSSAFNFSTLDGQAPTIPTNVRVSNITEKSVVISWKASTDNVGVKSYEIYRNGKRIGASKSTSYMVTGLNENAVQTFTVKAMDAVGNKSVLSAPIATRPTIKVIGNQVYTNFKLVNLGAGLAPTTVNGQMIVPLKPIFEALGLSITYDAKSKTVTGTKKGFSIKLTQGKNTAVINGKNKTMVVATFVKNGKLMIPLGFVAKELGYQITVKK
jgi:chitodextrinase